MLTQARKAFSPHQVRNESVEPKSKRRAVASPSMSTSMAHQEFDYRNVQLKRVEEFKWLDDACKDQIEEYVRNLQKKSQFRSDKDAIAELARRFGAAAQNGGVHLYLLGTSLWGKTNDGKTKTLFPKTTPKKTLRSVIQTNFALPKLILAANLFSCQAFMAELQNEDPAPIDTTRRSYRLKVLWIRESEEKRQHNGAAAPAVVDLSADGRAVDINYLPSGKNVAALANYEKFVAQLACEDYLRHIHTIVESNSIGADVKINRIAGLLQQASYTLAFEYDDARHLRGGSVNAHRAAAAVDIKKAAADKRAAAKAVKAAAGAGSTKTQLKGVSYPAPSTAAALQSDFVPTTVSGGPGGRARSAYYSRYADYPY